MSSPVFIEQLDSAIEVLLTDADVAIPNVDAQVAALLGITAELRTLPRPDFRSQLKVQLMERAASASMQPDLRVLDGLASRTRTKRNGLVQEQILPTLFGEGYGIYQVRRSNFAISFAAHALALAVILTSGMWVVQHRATVVQEVIALAPDITDYVPLTKSSSTVAGGGGGGDRDKVATP